MKKQTGNIIKKYRELSLPARTAFWYFISSIIQKMISVFSTVIFTRILTTSDYGFISVYSSWQEILYILATLSLSTGVYNVGMAKNPNHYNEYTYSLEIISSIVAIIFGILFSIFYPVINHVIQIKYILILPMLIMFVFLPAYRLWTAKQRFMMTAKPILISVVMESVITLLASIAVVLSVDNKGEGKALTGIAVSMAFGIFFWILNGKESHYYLNKKYWKPALTYNLQMIPAFLSAVVFNQIDRVMINNMVGADKAGIYSVAYNAAMFISIVCSALNVTINPWLMNRIHSRDFRNISRISDSICYLFSIGYVFFCLLAPDLIKILASKDYYEAIYVVPPVAGSMFFTLIYNFYSPIVQYFFKPKMLSVINVFIAILNIILNYFAIKRWDYIAAAYTTLICYIIYGWGCAIYAMSIMKANSLKVFFDNKVFIITSIFIVFLTIAISFLYDKPDIIRLVVFFIIVFIMFIKRKSLIKKIKELR